MAEFEALGPGGTEAQFQQFLAYLFKQTSTGLATPGVVAGLAVAQTATASASVLVGAGMAVAQDTVLNGATPLINNTVKTQDVLVANPASANPRNDIVVFDAGTKTIRVITGTPNATPADPVTPSTAVPLARLRILGSATTVPTAQIDDLRSFTTLFGTPAAGAWVTMPMNTAGGWTAVAGNVPRARLLPDGRVEMDGVALAAASITRNDPFVVPAQFIPSATRWLPATRTSGSAAGKTVTPNVQTDGKYIFNTAYAEGGSLPLSVAYPITGTYVL